MGEDCVRLINAKMLYEGLYGYHKVAGGACLVVEVFGCTMSGLGTCQYCEQ